MGQEHNYTSNLSSFLMWHVWVNLNCTEDEIDIFNDPNSTAEAKKELYERWLADQQITSYTRIVNGEIVQFQEWSW